MLNETNFSEWKQKSLFIEENKYRIREGAINYALRSRHTNGLDIAVRKIGKCIMIHEPTFVRWLEEQKS